MPPRPRRGALGLRGRIVGAVIVTTVATLGVAALALLGPLEKSLRQEAKTDARAGRRGAPAAFKQLKLDYVLESAAATTERPVGAQRAQLALLRRSSELGSRLGAR